MSIWRKVSWAFVHNNAVMKSFHATWCYDPGNISLKGSPEKSKFNAIFFPLIQSKRKWLLQNFVHDMTLVLSCHLQKIVAICWPVIQLWISVFHLISILMEKHQWNDPMPVNRDISQKLLEIYLIFCINYNALLLFLIHFSQNIYNKHAMSWYCIFFGVLPFTKANPLYLQCVSVFRASNWYIPYSVTGTEPEPARRCWRRPASRPVLSRYCIFFGVLPFTKANPFPPHYIFVLAFSDHNLLCLIDTYFHKDMNGEVVLFTIGLDIGFSFVRWSVTL